MRAKVLLHKSIAVLSLIIFCSVYLGVLVQSIAKNIHIIITSIFLIIGYWSIKKRGKIEKREFYGCFVSMIIVQIIVGYYLRVEYSTWDVYAVTQNAAALAKGEYFNAPYFARYPNNIAILLLFTLVFKVTNYLFGSTSVMFLIMLNIMAIDSAVWLTVKLVKMLKSEELAWRTGTVMVLFAPFYLYVPICYTDTFSLPIMIGLVYWIIWYAFNQEKIVKWKSVFHTIGIGAFIILGYKLKGSIMIILVATIIYFFLKFELKIFVKKILWILIGAFLAIVIWKVGVDSINLIKQEEYNEYQFPVSHWIMMGLSGSGSYRQEEVDFTMAIPSYEKKKEATLEKIREKVNELGVRGIFTQLYKKAVTYGWNYGTCYAERYLGDVGDQPIRKNVLHEFVLSQGKWHKEFYILTQSMWLLLFGASALQFISGLKNENLEFFFLRLIIFGCMLFFMIWETHPRYILNYTPLVIIIGTTQWEYYLDKFLEKMNLRKKPGKKMK